MGRGMIFIPVIDKLIKHAPQIIESAAKSPLGIFALMVLAVSVLGFTFFHDASEATRAGIFVLMLVGVGAFGFAAVRSAPAGAARDEETSSPAEAVDSPAAGGGAAVSLRRKPATVSGDQVKVSLAKYGFYDKRWNPGGGRAAVRYETKVLDDAVVVVDGSAGLMWQKGGSREVVFDMAKQYVGQLNTERLAGFNDWRLPTVEEAMSLMRAEAHDDFHIDRAFERGVNFIWTADHAGDGRVWVLYFYDGIVAAEPEGFNAWVRAVRCV